MLKFIAHRVGRYVVMLYVALTLTYFLASAVMRPRSQFEKQTPPMSEHAIDVMLNHANVNDQTPIVERYLTWLKGVVLHWDWGLSPTGSPVGATIVPRMLASGRLVFLSAILSLVIGVSLGVYTAMRQYRWQDRLFGATSTFFMVVPYPVLALMIILGAISINNSVGNRIFYVTGLSSYSGDNPMLMFVDFLQHIFLPTLVLTLVGVVGYHLSQRTYLLDEMHAEYVKTAMSKGLTREQAIRRHALRVSMVPTAIGVAYTVAGIFTGGVITETTFGINGLGKYFLDAMGNDDINATMASTAFGGACTLIGAIFADLVSAWLDPRIRMS